MQKWLTWLLAGLVLVLGWLSWQSYQREQAHLRARIHALTYHAAQAADAARVLQQRPDSTYDRYRGFFHTRAFEAAARRMPESTVMGGCDSRSICPNLFMEEELPNHLLGMVEERLFEADTRLRRLEQKRSITRRDLQEFFAYMEQALLELWDARTAHLK